jgi:ribosomal-protein-alanine N-acetyltransferase
MLIRNYKPTDKSALLQIIRDNTPAYFAPEEEHDFSNYLDNEIEAYFVVETDGKIIGCGGVNFEENKTIGIISWGMIHPDYHGKKIGSALLQHRLDFLNRIESIQRITVRTSQFVYQFYEKLGFQLIESKKDFWCPGIDLYYMVYKK